MKIKGEDRQTVIVLGAGASRGALKHVLVSGKQLRPPLNSDFFAVAATLARARGNESPEANRLRRLNEFFEHDLPVKGDLTMEEAFSLLYIAKDFPGIFRRRRGRRPPPGGRKEIADFLELVFGILSALDDGSHGPNGYDDLVSMLGPDDMIITLNYDTLLDSALFRAGWDPCTGYGFGGAPGMVRWQQSVAPGNHTLKRVRLLKLHGSLNWYVRGSYANLSAVFDKKPVRILKPRKNGVDRHVRQIIPPIHGKFFRHPHWRRLWDSAYNALQETDILVVVGCSLVETDFHLRALISRVARYRKDSERLFGRVLLADRSTVRKKWSKALRGTTNCFQSVTKFEHFLEKGFVR